MYLCDCIMKKIDRETVQKILDAADIVEVVSDFVSLKRRGANYIGLCPFHNERTPSFSVSKSKGICKCFSCGKGGSPVNFLMELEQLSFNEALRYLAKKYNIEIQEHEMTDAERDAANEREALLAVNDFACKHFEHNLWDTADGRDIGYSYFRERGISDESMRRFKLGYAQEKSEDLSSAAFKAGYSEKYLVASGLCSKSERGLYDRFKGRVIYPVFSVSGRIVAFGGRTLRKDKNVAKYVNSPESALYKKSYELYGLYQAKQQIVRKDKCILVEGYMDVISMSQIGVENVVASSGTSLTDGQIRLIHRFTNNVTVIYDSDPAGIKASLRGIDMLLAEGLDIKVLLLPEGDDPDSFAQSHTLEQVEAYMAENETDFIRFKTRILLSDAKDDPMQRARVISDIVGSISKIPEAIKRQVYIQECSRMLDMSEKVLSLELTKVMARNAEKTESERMRVQARESLRGTSAYQPSDEPEVEAPLDPHEEGQAATVNPVQEGYVSSISESPEDRAERLASEARARHLERYEHELIRYIVRYGMVTLCESFADDNVAVPMSVFEFVAQSLAVDSLGFSNPTYGAIFARVQGLLGQYAEDREAEEMKIKTLISKKRADGFEQIRLEGKDLNDMHARELMLDERLKREEERLRHEFALNYVVRSLASDTDDSIRRSATEMAGDSYTLSKVHTKFSHVETEEERLTELVPLAVYALQDAVITWHRNELMAALKIAEKLGDISRQQDLLLQIIELKKTAQQFAQVLGERVVTPGK